MGDVLQRSCHGKDCLSFIKRNYQAGWVRESTTYEIPKYLTTGWLQLQRGFSAWLREIDCDDGKVIPLLAMRWELTTQIGVVLPGVHNQATLRQLGNRFGLFDDNPQIAGRLTGGERLCILSRELTEELLFDPTDHTPNSRSQ